MVLISKENKRKVYEYLLNEGVIVIKKDHHLPVHADTEVPNLHVWMLLRSLKDKALVTLTFNWQYYYYCITQEGVPFLRTQLGYTDDSIVPKTFQQDSKRTNIGRAEDEDEDRPRRFGRGGGRGGKPRQQYPKVGRPGYGRSAPKGEEEEEQQ